MTTATATESTSRVDFKKYAANGTEICVGARVCSLLLIRQYIPPSMPFDSPSYTPSVVWVAKCECGEETRTTEEKLVNGKALACWECMEKKINYFRIKKKITPVDVDKPVESPGSIIGELLLIRKDNDGRWDVKCSCGTIFKASEKKIFSKRNPVVKCANCAAK